jgi:putative ABC transport system permease protein
MIISCPHSPKLAPNIEEQWGNFGAATFLCCKPGTNAKAEAKFPAFLETRYRDEAKQNVLQFISRAA